MNKRIEIASRRAAIKELDEMIVTLQRNFYATGRRPPRWLVEHLLNRRKRLGHELVD